MAPARRFRGGGASSGWQLPAAIAITILLMASVESRARIFNRWKGSSDSARALESAGGKLAYEADISLNGGDGHLKIFGFQSHLHDLVKELNRFFGDAIAKPRGSMSQTIIRDKNKVLRLLIVDLGDQGQTMVFAMEQSQADFKISSSAPAEHLLRAIPPYPGSNPVFHAEDKNTDMSLAVSSTQAEPETVKGYYDEQLHQKGWLTANEAFRPKRAGKPSQPLQLRGFNLYVRGGEICMILASPGDRLGTTSISVLHKQMQMD
jgi:hypothetical protein